MNIVGRRLRPERVELRQLSRRTATCSAAVAVIVIVMAASICTRVADARLVDWEPGVCPASEDFPQLDRHCPKCCFARLPYTTCDMVCRVPCGGDLYDEYVLKIDAIADENEYKYYMRFWETDRYYSPYVVFNRW